MNYLRLILGGLILLALGIGLGYYFSPSKIKIQEKVVEKIVTEKDEKITKKYDPKTGKLTEEVKETKEKETNTSKTSKTTEKSRDQKHYAVKAGAVFNPKDLNAKLTPRVGLEIRLPFFSSWAGVEGDISVSKPNLAVYGRVEF